MPHPREVIMSGGSSVRVLALSVIVLCCLGGSASAQQAWPHDSGFVAEIDTYNPVPSHGGQFDFIPSFNVNVHGFSMQSVCFTTKVTIGPFLARNDLMVNG